MQITITLDKTDKYLDKQRQIEDNDGWKRTVDGFYVHGMSKNSVNIIFFKLVPIAETENMKWQQMKIMDKTKRVKYIDGKMTISICGFEYQVGTYTESLQ